MPSVKLTYFFKEDSFSQEMQENKDTIQKNKEIQQSYLMNTSDFVYKCKVFFSYALTYTFQCVF